MPTTPIAPPAPGDALFLRSSRSWWLVLPFGAALSCSALADRTAPAVIERELLVPYLSALNAGDVDRAWRDYTTEGYRRTTSRLVYLAGQARNRDAYGPRVRASLSADDPSPLTEPGRPPMLRVTARWAGDAGETQVVLDLVDGPPWRIERTWTWPDDHLGTERVY